LNEWVLAQAAGICLGIAGTYLSTIPEDQTWAWAFILWIFGNGSLMIWALSIGEPYLAFFYLVYLLFAFLGVHRIFRKWEVY
jgi:drug/metabolite transporter (DMT)-like permease